MNISKARLATLAGLSLTLSLGLAGCGATNNATQVAQTDAATTAAATTTAATTSSDATTADDSMFTNRDRENTYTDAIDVTLADGASSSTGAGVSVAGNVVTITQAGTYKLSGTLTDGQVVVEVADTDKVQIVLDGATISSSSSAALYIKQGDKVFVTSEAGSTNALSTTGDYVQTDDNTVDGAIFSKADLCLNGTGKLTVSSTTGHGVVSKDDLKVTSGTYVIDAAGQGLSGKDSVRIGGGDITVTCGTDGVHSENEDNAEKGFVYMEAGTLTIDADDDGIHASGTLTICGGTVNITRCYEGLEGLTINMEGGDVSLVASDDGLNATNGSGADEGMGAMGGGMGAMGGMGGGMGKGTMGRDMGEVAPGGDGAANDAAAATADAATDAAVGSADATTTATSSATPSIVISGGTLTVDASGDGLDSNGTITVTGGTTIVNGPTSGGDGALDYGSSATVDGGTVIALGSSGMATGFTAGSQGAILYNLSSTFAAGTTVSIADESGKVLASTTSTKQFQSVAITAPGMAQGSTYTLTVGSETYQVTLDSTQTSNSAGGMGGMGGMGGDRGAMGGDTNMRGNMAAQGAVGQDAPTA